MTLNQVNSMCLIIFILKLVVQQLVNYCKRRTLKVTFKLIKICLQDQRNKRFIWAKVHRNWTKKDWQQVIVSDESVFRTYNHRKKQRVWRRNHEKFHPECINSKVKHPLSVQVWGAISYFGKSQLKQFNVNLNSIKNQTEILQDIKLKCDCLAYPIKNYIFMHDKAPCHFSASTQRY